MNRLIAFGLNLSVTVITSNCCICVVHFFSRIPQGKHTIKMYLFKDFPNGFLKDQNQNVERKKKIKSKTTNMKKQNLYKSMNK